ncbi:hypothetical protein C5167_000358 [Papaver somniferum]|uniref:Alpha-soluble NSF attachment protein n=1 Tax=Papaver somniferum TaxID=3469 RepID=A0A4Y7KV84_PAPSO|nr:hypothetical protein C5167_000358 [Papaver somniferum]
MGDQIAKGEEFLNKAEKKINSWALFSSKYEDAAELYENSANSFKIAKAWDRAAAVYIKLAGCHLKLDSRHDAASAYVASANAYKKNVSKRGDIMLGAGTDLFQSEEVNTAANQCKLKVAEFAAQQEQYPKAIGIYEDMARQSLNNKLLNYNVKGYLLNAGLCQLRKDDIVALTNALEKYQDLDPTFTGTRECKLLTDLAAATDEEDVGKFTDAVKEYESMTRLDAWKTTILSRANEALKEKELRGHDLT